VIKSSKSSRDAQSVDLKYKQAITSKSRFDGQILLNATTGKDLQC